MLNFKSLSLLVALTCILGCCVTTSHAQQSGCGLGLCGETHLGPGCVDIDCCTGVCGIVPICCETNWDANCLFYANQTCQICGIPGLGSCFIPHIKASCADSACCEIVCAIDSFCCESSWDSNCAFTAQETCVLPPPMSCGDPNAGNCLQAHGNSSCADATCCQLVCAGSPNCCEVIWDDLCAFVAVQLCNSNCTLTCPAGASNESESCSTLTNDPSIRPDSVGPNTPQTIPTQATICGKIFTTNDNGSSQVDVDVYAIDLRNADTDRDGLVKVSVTLASAQPVFAALVPTNSTETSLPGGLVLVNAAACSSGRDWTCVAPAQYWIVIAPGANGIISSQTIDCANGKYWMKVETAATCALPCVNATGGCFDVHGTPSCVDPSCCSMVCAFIASCCESAWDADCAILAAEDCGAPAPANDTCATPLDIETGSTNITLLGSTAAAPTFSCAANPTATGGDVWLRWTSPQATYGEYQIDVCGATFDTRMDIFTGSCSALTLKECSDNSVLCSPNYASRVTLDTTCATPYLIRVASLNGQTGFATMHITLISSAQTCCVEDLNNSGDVDASDLGTALGQFGPCQNCSADFNNSGDVDSSDLGQLLGNYGLCP